MDTAGRAEQVPCGKCNTDTAADRRADRGSCHTKFGKEADAENEARRKDDVQAVREYQYAHCHRRIARSAKDRVEQKDEHYYGIAAKHDLHEPRTFSHDLGPGSQ